MACAASTRLSPKNPADASLWVLKKDVILYCCKEKNAVRLNAMFNNRTTIRRSSNSAKVQSSRNTGQSEKHKQINLSK
jgi:hypothetical protein